MKLDKVASLTVHPGVENRLTLKYGNATNAWTITIAPSNGSSFDFKLTLQGPVEQELVRDASHN